VRIGLRERSILVIGYVAFLVYAFPGYLSTDSQNQLMEARSGHFTDAHPPLMSAMWRVLDMVVSGPVLMLVLQSGLFLGGLYVVFRRVLSPRAAAWTASAILLFPPVMTPLAVIWKDSQMAGFLVAGIAAVLGAQLRIRLLGLGLLVLACAVRHNAFAAVVPLVFFLFEWRHGMRWWKRTAIVGGAAVFAVLAMLLISRILTVQSIKMTPAFQDIVGVLAFADDKSDEELRDTLAGLELVSDRDLQQRCRRLYELRGAWRITQGDEALMRLPDTDEEWRALSRAWKTLVLSEPHAYLSYHWDTYKPMIGLPERPRAPVYNLFVEVDAAADEIRHNASYSKAQRYAARVLYWVADETPLFRPWIYAVTALLLLILFARDRVTIGIITSGLVYELSYLPVGADPDFRYSHWMITATVIATVMLVIQRRRAA